MISTSGRSW